MFLANKKSSTVVQTCQTSTGDFLEKWGVVSVGNVQKGRSWKLRIDNFVGESECTAVSIFEIHNIYLGSKWTHPVGSFYGNPPVDLNI